MVEQHQTDARFCRHRREERAALAQRVVGTLGGSGLPTDAARRPPQQAGERNHLDQRSGRRPERRVVVAELLPPRAQPADHDWKNHDRQDQPAQDDTPGVSAPKRSCDAVLRHGRDRADAQSRDHCCRLERDAGDPCQGIELASPIQVSDQRERCDAHDDDAQSCRPPARRLAPCDQ